jgi:hypothetical protein
MSTLEIQAPHAPQARLSLGGFARVAAALLAVIDVYTEAQRQAHEAQQRYPVTAW